jgi:hypothetical protein
MISPGDWSDALWLRESIDEDRKRRQSDPIDSA